MSLHRSFSPWFVGLTFCGASHVLAIAGVDKPPAPSAPHAISFAQPKDMTLENGLRVIVAERPDLPVIAAYLLIRRGAEVDPAGLAGAASLTGSLLTKGTAKMSAPEIAEAIESLGGSISSGAGWDSASATIAVMSDNAAPALAILADVVLHPAFQQEEIDRLKRQRTDGIRVALQQPGSLASYVTTRVVFGDTAYGHPVGGTIESLRAIRRDDIVKLYEASYAPANATLIFSGNLTAAQGRGYAEKFFGQWKGRAPAAKESAPVVAKDDWKPSHLVIDMPQAGQAAVVIAKPAIKRNVPEYYAGMVANAALGNGFVSRLNQEIRIKRGLSYGAHSALETRRDAGPFAASAQTKNESGAEVAGLLQGELRRLVSEPVTGDELKSRKAVLTGSYARAMETNSGFAGQIASLTTYGLPLATIDHYIADVEAVTAENVTAFAEKYLATPASLVIVGKAAAFLEPLKKAFPDVRVIPQDELDLNRADLLKAK